MKNKRIYNCTCKFCGRKFRSIFIKEVCNNAACQRLFKKSGKPIYDIDTVVRMAKEHDVHYGAMSLYMDTGIKTW